MKTAPQSGYCAESALVTAAECPILAEDRHVCSTAVCSAFHLPGLCFQEIGCGVRARVLARVRLCAWRSQSMCPWPCVWLCVAVCVTAIRCRSGANHTWVSDHARVGTHTAPEAAASVCLTMWAVGYGHLRMPRAQGKTRCEGDTLALWATHMSLWGDIALPSYDTECGCVADATCG